MTITLGGRVSLCNCLYYTIFSKVVYLSFCQLPLNPKTATCKMQILVENLIITKPLPGTAPGICKFFFFKCTTAKWSGKENVILTMRPFGQSQSKITAASGNVDQSKPDSHFDSQIDPYI